jgi:sec-independent protein translocase protein TatA
MGSFSIWHWLVVLAVVLLLFGGGGKISKIMGDMAKGVKSFKKGLKEEDEEVAVGAPPVLSSSENPVVDTGARKDEAAKT